ncbi:hypothetical protein DPMN_112585 [Dreissena polymorpha]|uniref:Uncharacterized protein n=1 Tax=Dreissena polymorpha TaxID=45954 RepID=A0A9D4QPW2_DREPO|nr:hypothetical protein DPMN_112585 [Dreissena polymorpha]
MNGYYIYNFVYVGETGDTLYQRHLLNLSRIRTRRKDPVAEQFCTNGDSVADFRVMGLETFNGSESTGRPSSNFGSAN